MKYGITILVALIIIIGCASESFVEFGANDDVLLDAPLGDITMRVLRIEVPEGGTYTTVWDLGKRVTVPIQASGFVSITDGPVVIVPGTYDHARITVDSVCYVSDSTTLLIDTTYIFDANAFTDIVIEENEDMSLVINIVSTTWFDTNTGTISGTPFDQAALRVYYE
ncbi:hypothetical protein JXB22_04345 [candidate division WOR-3 bacterium]|nr:hypothetical protein [candidate division WOR-3 bacterium]